jgi:hypothetical protein
MVSTPTLYSAPVEIGTATTAATVTVITTF